MPGVPNIAVHLRGLEGISPCLDAVKVSIMRGNRCFAPAKGSHFILCLTSTVANLSPLSRGARGPRDIYVMVSYQPDIYPLKLRPTPRTPEFRARLVSMHISPRG
jgi:hypothetical protein